MFEDLRENALSQLKHQTERFQESSAFNQLKDRYENLSPSMQRFVLAGTVALIAFLFMSIPLGYFSSSSTFVEEFESKRQTIRDLLKASREAQDVPSIPIPPSPDDLRSRIEQVLAQSRLTPEQIKSVQVSSVSSGMIPGNLTQGAVDVTLAKLNLRQIVDIGHQIQSFSPSIKLKDLSMTANAEDGRYFDIIYKLIVLAVPNMEAPAPIEEPPAPRQKKGG